MLNAKCLPSRYNDFSPGESIWPVPTSYRGRLLTTGPGCIPRACLWERVGMAAAAPRDKRLRLRTSSCTSCAIWVMLLPARISRASVIGMRSVFLSRIPAPTRSRFGTFASWRTLRSSMGSSRSIARRGDGSIRTRIRAFRDWPRAIWRRIAPAKAQGRGLVTEYLLHEKDPKPNFRG